MVKRSTPLSEMSPSLTTPPLEPSRLIAKLRAVTQQENVIRGNEMRKETRSKEKYRSTDNTKNGKRKGNLPKNDEISGGKAYTNTWKFNLNILTIAGVFLDQKRVTDPERHL